MRLDGHVGQVRLLHARGRLHLGGAEAPVGPTLQDIDRHVHGIGAKARLVDHRGARGERRPRGLEPRLVGVVGQVDQHAARHVLARHLAHPPATRERRLPHRIGHELGRPRLMHPPPQLLRALQPGQDAGLRQAVRRRGPGDRRHASLS